MYALGIDLGTTLHRRRGAARRPCRDRRARQPRRRDPVGGVRCGRTARCSSARPPSGGRSTEPARVAREFKRRIGDPTPILLGGSPYSAEALMAQLLRAVVGRGRRARGRAAGRDRRHPPGQLGAVQAGAARPGGPLADLDSGHAASPSPRPPRSHYAATSGSRRASVVAVYDLGGGTFDAAVLRKTDDGFEILGEPEGIEQPRRRSTSTRPCFGHVDRRARRRARGARPGRPGGRWRRGPAAARSASRPRRRCPSDTDVAIPVAAARPAHRGAADPRRVRGDDRARRCATRSPRCGGRCAVGRRRARAR